MEIVEPGLAFLPDWRPESADEAGDVAPTGLQRRRPRRVLLVRRIDPARYRIQRVTIAETAGLTHSAGRRSAQRRKPDG
jgi:hypothetical protein